MKTRAIWAKIGLFLLLSLSSLWLLLSCQATPPLLREKAQVQRVVSGQTLTVLLQDSSSPQQVSVRLIGLSTPDLSQVPWGPDAQTALQTWLKDGSDLELEWDRQRQDPFQRYLAYVWKDGRLLNEQLLAQGYAIAETHAPNTKYQERLAHAQLYARIMGYGIWNPQNPLRTSPKIARQQRQTPPQDR